MLMWLLYMDMVMEWLITQDLAIAMLDPLCSDIPIFTRDLLSLVPMVLVWLVLGLLWVSIIQLVTVTNLGLMLLELVLVLLEYMGIIFIIIMAKEVLNLMEFPWEDMLMEPPLELLLLVLVTATRLVPTLLGLESMVTLESWQIVFIIMAREVLSQNHMVPQHMLEGLFLGILMDTWLLMLMVMVLYMV